MHVTELEVYSDETNYAVIKPPGRQFPGCVIQGDSLRILCRSAQRIAEHAKEGTTDDDECLLEIEDLVNSLIDRLRHYQTVLHAHGLSLPYFGELSEADYVRFRDTDSGDSPETS
jgi:hypothetical protein